MEPGLFSPSQFLVLFSLLGPPVPSGAPVLPCSGLDTGLSLTLLLGSSTVFCPPALQISTSILAVGGVGGMLDRGGLWNFKEKNTKPFLKDWNLWNKWWTCCHRKHNLYENLTKITISESGMSASSVLWAGLSNIWTQVSLKCQVTSCESDMWGYEETMSAICKTLIEMNPFSLKNIVEYCRIKPDKEAKKSMESHPDLSYETTYICPNSTKIPCSSGCCSYFTNDLILTMIRNIGAIWTQNRGKISILSVNLPANALSVILIIVLTTESMKALIEYSADQIIICFKICANYNMGF